MKKYVWLLFLLTTFIASNAITTQAQSTRGIRANIPFEFTVGDQTIRAGTISARELNAANSGALAISNLNNGQHVIRIAHAVSTYRETDRPKFVFHKCGNHYYLVQVWIPGYNALGLKQSQAERAIRHDTLLSKNSAPELVTIIADVL
jgi:hypothetical protein